MRSSHPRPGSLPAHGPFAVAALCALTVVAGIILCPSASGQIIAPGSALENAVVFIPIEGEITPSLCDRIRRDIEACRSEGAEHLIFRIDSEGGDLAAAQQLAREIHSARYTSYAYVDNDKTAFDAAALIAVACTHLLMGVDASIGRIDASDDRVPTLDDLRRELAGYANANPDYPEAILRAWATPAEPVVKLTFRNARGTRTEFVMKSERSARNERDVVDEVELPWADIAIIDDEEALRFGLVDEVYAHRSRFLNSFAALRTLNPREVDEALGRSVRVDGQVLDLFRDYEFPRWVKFLLILFGVVGLVVELKMPGTFIGGGLFLICFTLFFLEGFANQMVGWTEIILFPLALGLMIAEVFVIPGFGVAGILGLGLLFTSLTLGLIPEEQDLTWGGVSSQLFNVIVSLAGSGIVVVLILRFLPGGGGTEGAGLISRTRLDEDGRVGDSGRGVPEAAALVGKRGVVQSALRPAGKVLLDGEDSPLDVVAAGSFIARDTPVEVVEVEGNRIVVDIVEDVGPAGGAA